MDRKSWPWKKKSTEKTPVETHEGKDEEKKFQYEHAKWDNELKNLQEKLSLTLAECNAKDELMKMHERNAQDTQAELEKAEDENIALKQKLDEALRERITGKERISQVEGALRECKEELSFVRDEQEHRINDAVWKTSEEYERRQRISDEKMEEMSKSLAKAASENAQLGKVLVEKDKIIEDLSRQRNKIDTDAIALKGRLESSEKENTSLKYEIRVLEKEIEIWNEEREVNRRTAEASHKKHLENVKKISKLESECQRLRLMVRKRLPGPAALARMKNEVEIMAKDSVVIRKKPSACLTDQPVGVADEYPEDVSRRADMLAERLYAMEEENKVLKEAINKKLSELQFSRHMYARTASKLLEVESQLEESSKGHVNIGTARSEFSVASVSDIDNDDKDSCAYSSASALISELEHFKNKKENGSIAAKPVGASEIDLMDDFLEMEKLALGSSREGNEIVESMGTRSSGNSSEIPGRDVISVSDSHANVHRASSEARLKTNGVRHHGLHDIIVAILEQQRVSEKSVGEILEDIRQALSHLNYLNPNHPDVEGESLLDCEISGSADANGHVALKTSKSSVQTDAKEAVTDSSQVKHCYQSHSDDLVKSIRMIIELVKGINLDSQRDFSETCSRNTTYVFQWKTSDLNDILQEFSHTCLDMLYGKADITKFSQVLCSSLGWVISHCFPLQHVSSMTEISSYDQVSDVNKILLPMESLDVLSTVAGSTSHSELLCSANKLQTPSRGNMTLGEAKVVRGPEAVHHSNCSSDECLENQIHESKRTIADLQKELEILKQSGSLVKDECLENKIATVKGEVNEVTGESSSIEAESNKNITPNGADYTWPESETMQGTFQHQTKGEAQRPIRTDLEISAASEKLAECQETILHLGKQLKALTSEELSLQDRCTTRMEKDNIAPILSISVSTPPKGELTSQKSTLLDQMKAEEDSETDTPKSAMKKPNENLVRPTFITNETIEALEKILLPDKGKRTKGSKSLAIVPRKKEGLKSLWKRLIWRKKRSKSKKLPTPV